MILATSARKRLSPGATIRPRWQAGQSLPLSSGAASDMSKKRKTAERDEVRAVPSAMLRSMIDSYGGINKAAKAWGVEYVSLRRFLKEGSTLTLDTAAVIAHRLGVSPAALFETEAK